MFQPARRSCRSADLRGPACSCARVAAAGGFKRMTGFCKTRIPPDMAAMVDKLSGDDCKDPFTTFGVDYMVALCKKLVASKLVPGLHFYCLNQSERACPPTEAEKSLALHALCRRSPPSKRPPLSGWMVARLELTCRFCPPSSAPDSRST